MELPSSNRPFDMGNVDLSRYSQRIIQYFWDSAPRNEDEAPIWCLGKRYLTASHSTEDVSKAPTLSNGQEHHIPSFASSDQPNSLSQDTAGLREDDDTLAYERISIPDQNDAGWPPPFLDDFEARVWLTYRSSFPPIPKSQDPKAANSMSFSVRLKTQLSNSSDFTSDTGWGCMIRSGQSLLANALFILKLGRDWRRGSNPTEERRLLSLFADDPKAPFSIHNFVNHGALACGKYPGEWFGPSATASCIRALTHNHSTAGLRVHVTSDGSDVYADKFLKDALDSNGSFRPTLLLLGLRLGIDRVTPVYWDALKATLQMEQSVGIAGGRPSSSHYFVGVQGDYLFYLDPHQPRPALPLIESVEDYAQEDIDSCHTRRLRRVHIREMDPSMLIAFLIRDERDWDAWRRAVSEAPGAAIIHVSEQEPQVGNQGAERREAIDEVEAFDDEYT